MALAVTFTFGSDILTSVKSAFSFNGKVMKTLRLFLTLGGVCLFFVCGASAVDPHRVSVMEGDTVTLHTNVELNQRDRMTCFFGVNRIAVINKDQIKICTDDECKERFRDRLKLNNQTGSLTIMNITNTDSGDYKVLIISHILQNSVSITSLKTFIFTVIDSGLSSAAVAGICVAVVLLFVTAAVGVIYYCKCLQAGQNNPTAQSSLEMGVI